MQATVIAEGKCCGTHDLATTTLRLCARHHHVFRRKDLLIHCVVQNDEVQYGAARCGAELKRRMDLPGRSALSSAKRQGAELCSGDTM